MSAGYDARRRTLFIWEGVTMYLPLAAVDETLANRSERARKYLGWPMLFLMRLAPASQAASLPAASNANSSPPNTKR